MARTVGVYLADDTIDRLDHLAETHDTDRAALIRACVDIGLNAREHTDGNKFHRKVKHHETEDAIDMTEQGHHPRWNPPE